MRALHLATGLVLALAACFSSPARAQEANPALAPFFGSFSGRGVAADSETPRGTPIKVRDLDIVIRPSGTGFVLTWATVLSHRRAGPHLHYPVTTYAFAPAGRPNWFVATELGNPLEGRPLVWARLDANTLHVTVYTVFEDGHNDLQIYTRTVKGDQMELSYTRVHENERVVSVRGWLARRPD
jgi:hypothetical protein